MTFKGDCVLEGDGDQLAYDLTVTDFSANVAGVSEDSVSEYMNEIIGQFNGSEPKLKVPARGLSDDYPQGMWRFEVTVDGVRVLFYADVQADSSTNGIIGIGLAAQDENAEMARGSWSKGSGGDQRATFEFIFGSSAAKITLVRQ